MRRDKRLLTTLWRGLRAIVRRPASPEPPAPAAPMISAFVPEVLNVVVIEDGTDHDRWFHPVH
jgi:hypothetical protein